MASRRKHRQDCIERLGNDWDEVHAWLDGRFMECNGHIRHRIYRHNAEGVEKIRKWWGDEAAQAAKIHIQRDFGLLDVPGVSLDEIPKNMKDAAVILAIILEDQK